MLDGAPYVIIVSLWHEIARGMEKEEEGLTDGRSVSLSEGLSFKLAPFSSLNSPLCPLEVALKTPWWSWGPRKSRMPRRS